MSIQNVKSAPLDMMREFHLIDGNKDQKISKEEFDAWVENEHRVGNFTREEADQLKERFQLEAMRFDENSDNPQAILSRKELTIWLEINFPEIFPNSPYNQLRILPRDIGFKPLNG